MKEHLGYLLIAATAGALSFGCASTQKKEVDVHVSEGELSAPARATVARVTAGGKVDQITKENERGKVVYDVEATMAGKHEEFTIADADGAVLGTETSIDFNQLPAPVQMAARKYFGTTDGLKSMKGVEYGETSYEVEGPKSGKVVEITFDGSGKRAK
jgi:uncharacterized membrane protein YkoI